MSDRPLRADPCVGFNLLRRHDPARVVMPRSAAEVATAVAEARDAGLQVAILSTGHGSGPLCRGGMLINMRSMAGVTIDPAARVARVDGGARWGAVLAAAAPHGLAGLAGSSPAVGVAGYALAGGLGWLARRYGLAAHGILAVEMVTADGQLRRIDGAGDPDLFWALRGGGWELGVVTALEIRLFPVPRFFGGAVFHPIEMAAAAFARFAEFVATAPDSVTAALSLMRLPADPALPPALSGRHVAVLSGVACEPETGPELLAPLRRIGPALCDTFAERPFAEIGAVTNDPEGPLASAGTGIGIARFDAALAARLLAFAEAEAGMLHMELRHVAGAVSRGAAGAPTMGEAPFALFAIFDPAGPEGPAGAVAAADRFLDATAAHHGYGPSLSYADDRPESGDRILPPAVRARLGAIRDRVDPDGLFRIAPRWTVPPGA